MSQKADKILHAALALVEDMTPERRTTLAMTMSAGTASMEDMRLGKLVIAVEASRLHPGDEVFTLLRRDPAAPDTIRFWATKAESLARGVSNSPKCDQARAVAERWRDWQGNNLLKTKVPD